MNRRYPGEFTPAEALRYVEFMNAAYSQFYNFRYDNDHTEPQPPLPFQVPYNYQLLWELWGIDIDPTLLKSLLGKDISPEEMQALWEGPKSTQVPFGYAAVSPDPDNTKLVIAVRGTEGILEFITNLSGLGQSACPVPGAKDKGKILQAASLIYQTLAWKPTGEVEKDLLKNGWPELNIPKLTSCVITGHSLGACLISPLAIDWDLNGPTDIKPAVYSFAGPRVGDPAFAKYFDEQIHDGYRVANGPDIPTHLPPKLYWFPTSWKFWSRKVWKRYRSQHVKHGVAVGSRFSIVWLISSILMHWGLRKFLVWGANDMVYNHSLAAYAKGLQFLPQPESTTP